MSEIKLKWKNDTQETEYERGAREAVEAALKTFCGECDYKPKELLDGDFSIARGWQQILKREELALDEPRSVSFEELRDGDLVRFPVGGLKYRTVHQKAVWILSGIETPHKAPISHFKRVEVHRDGKWLKVVE